MSVQHQPITPGTVAGVIGGVWVACGVWGWKGVAGSVAVLGWVLWRRPGLRARIAAAIRVTARAAADIAAGRSRRPAPGSTVDPEPVTAPVAAPTAPAAPAAPENDPPDVAVIRDAIDGVFTTFGVAARVDAYTRGPTVTRYEVVIGAGVKVGRITQLVPNIGYATGCDRIRVVSPIPGRSAIGIELPNEQRETVTLPAAMASPAMAGSHPLRVVLGKDIEGGYVTTDLGRLPHVLIAGATGSGKSSAINGLLCTLLTRAAPDRVRLLLIDPKRVELAAYTGVPHLVRPIVTDPRDAVAALEWAVAEMDARYEDMAAAGARNLDAYNDTTTRGAVTGPGGRVLGPYPYLVIVVDELADLMLTAKAQAEGAIVRLTQLARAAGIHLVLATQRPSVDVVTGLIKANVPARLAFAVASMVDSRTILDTGGAEQLLGRGDGLWLPGDAPTPVRLQGVMATEADIVAAVTAAHTHSPAPYHHAPAPAPAAAGTGTADTALLRQAIALTVETQLASASMLQRRLRLGWPKAARLVDEMEAIGVVGPAEGGKPRPVLITADDLPGLLARLDEADAF
ncbi:DNA segregation ATPase FtsK/SpoIIIE-like protein [Allocatelliglobosispora scoriae]|uniref:DNA segregation ATPase FtsK/SpoIIIE-like protein n=1 Tax=Allocatelliglobosispora scoriae TaxID=643052 RepID=A0A841BYX0_9ACTN|nr:DNA translocase FtsK [Allocatelliglobosispora scoriae]MBB5872002.1 DNA segregation ATPase FtsK/SpoIIIE-like protein [Allocatelliglobosispora scoriae]